MAHRSGDRELTYGELFRCADALAASLARELPADHAPIVVRGNKEPEMLIAFLGAVISGHPYIPLDISIPETRVERIVETARAAVVLTPERVQALTTETVPPPQRPLAAADPFYIIFTSGSTGEPKGVVITLECLTSFVDWMLAEQKFLPGQVFLNQAPFSFDLSVMDLYLSLVSGGTLFSLTQSQVSSPKHLFPALEKSHIENWVSTPSFAQMCLADRRFDATLLQNVRRFLFCGETLAPTIAQQLLERFPQAQVWNTYGPTEATVATTSIEITPRVLQQYAILPVGYPKPDTRILIHDANDLPVTQDGEGEIIIVGPNVSPGYLNAPDISRRSFFNAAGARAYRTGDAGFFRDGLLFFQGRLDLQIKLHGYRIELGDIEANLNLLPGVQNAVVLPILQDGVPNALAAFVLLEEMAPDGTFEQELRLRAQLAERLPGYMVPQKFFLMERLPLTPNGKADRKQLATMLADTP